MRYKLAFGAGFATGYYLGAKAGRERYAQIRSQLETIRRNPKVEAMTGKITSAVDAQIGKAKEAVATTLKATTLKDKVESAVDTARHAIGGVNRGTANCAPADGSPNGTATIPPAANPYSSSR